MAVERFIALHKFSYSFGALFHIRDEKRTSNECNMHIFIRIGVDGGKKKENDQPEHIHFLLCQAPVTIAARRHHDM